MSLVSPVPHSLAALDPRRVASLEWRQPQRGRRAWELIADGDVVGTLSWRGPWHRGWEAHAGGVAWSIEHGFLGRCRIVRDGEATPVATSRRWGFRSVRIQRAAGETLTWRHVGFFHSEHRLENREGFPLFRLERRRGFLRREGRLVLEDAGRALVDVLPLVLLCWALSLLEARAHAH